MPGVRISPLGPSPFVIIDTMATKGDFYFSVYFPQNSVFSELFTYLLAFNRQMKIGFLFFVPLVTAWLGPLSSLIVFLLGNRYSCRYSLS